MKFSCKLFTKVRDNAKSDPWMVGYGELTPLSVIAVQDQHQIFDKEETSIIEQEGRIVELQADIAGIK